MGSVEGGPFYRGQTQNALFIARSGWQFIEFPLKAKELRSRVGTRATRGAFIGNGREGGAKWHLFSFPPLCTYSRVCTHSLTRRKTFHLFLYRYLRARIHAFSRPPYLVPLENYSFAICNMYYFFAESF